MKALFRSALHSLVRLTHWAAPDFFPDRWQLDQRTQENVTLRSELERSRAGALTLARAVQEHCRPIREAMELRYAQAIAERDRQIAELATAADHDPLTGLYNRRGANAELHRTLDAFERRDYKASGEVTQHQLSVLVMDLNHFKVVNDTYGHATGDTVLVAVAEQLKAAFRPEDIVFRSSKAGDEFFVYLINASKGNAIGSAERFRQRLLEDTRLRFDDTHVSVSIGISHGSFTSKRGGLQIIDDVEKLADAAMYEAKQESRDFSGIVIAADAVFSDTVYSDL